jgi:hypothetical protein
MGSEDPELAADQSSAAKNNIPETFYLFYSLDEREKYSRKGKIWVKLNSDYSGRINLNPDRPE